jgi:hypothetical protein
VHFVVARAVGKAMRRANAGAPAQG